VKYGGSNKLVVDNAVALTFELKQGVDLLESVSLSLFSLGDDLRGRGGSGGNELRGCVILLRRDQERFLNRSNDL